MVEIALETKDLTKQYGQLKAVNGLSLQVYEGEVFGFLGPNGAGKTTSINMMCGLLKPDSGQVYLWGKPVAGANVDIRAQVGICPQNILLWERLTCIEQLQFIGQMYGLSKSTARERSEQLLAVVGLTPQRNMQARVLSGGMQRRLNLIMALVHDPKIVVLDEPEAGLDPQSRVLVRDFIRSLARKKTVILTTHNMDEAERIVDRVAIIDHGELLVLDTPEALLQRLGDGEVLEIDIAGNTHEGLAALAFLPDPVQIEAGEKTLFVHAHNAATLLPKTYDALQVAGLAPGEVRLRKNTLEDVFIQLTGRRLRE